MISLFDRLARDVLPTLPKIVLSVPLFKTVPLPLLTHDERAKHESNRVVLKNFMLIDSKNL